MSQRNNNKVPKENSIYKNREEQKEHDVNIDTKLIVRQIKINQSQFEKRDNNLIQLTSGQIDTNYE